MAPKKAKSTNPVPSSEVVDAYKTYLEKASTKLTAKDFAEGAPIPTDQVEKDILILENKIAQFKKYGFPFDKEEKQLEILKGYQQKVAGKHWPTAKQKLSACTHPAYQVVHVPNGQIHKICTSCSQTWAQDDVKAPFVPIFYNKKEIEAKKAEKKPILLVQKVPESLSVKVGKTELDQRFIMRMGMLSNCNVTIARLFGGTSSLVGSLSLLCSNCKQTKHISETNLFGQGDELPGLIEEFCIAHKHDARAVIAEGRHFRED